MLSRAFSRHLSQRTLSCAESAVLLSTAKTVALPARHASPQHSAYKPHGCRRRRALSIPAPSLDNNHSDLTMERYHALADATMTSLLDRLEDLLDGIANDAFEVDYHSGVLTLNLGPNGTYVINKQPPNKQIWLSSPVSGPKRYDYAPTTDDWRYSRDGEGMGVLMERELTRALGREAKIGLERISETVE